MSKELIVSATAHETKVAILEDDQVVEVFFEREKQFGLAGSIYKGRVTRVLPGMQSAFVNIGLERDAFLYVSDFLEDNEEYDRLASSAEERVLKADQQPARTEPVATPPAPPPAPPPAKSEEEPQPDLPPRYVDPRAGRDRFGGPRGRGRGGRGRPRGSRDAPRPGPGPHGFPESKFSQRHEPHRHEPPRYEAPRREAPRYEAPRPEPPGREGPTAGDFEVLPGESVAKYSRPLDEPEPPIPTPEEETSSGEETSLEDFRLDQRLEHAMPESDPEPEPEPELLDEAPVPAFESEPAAADFAADEALPPDAPLPEAPPPDFPPPDDFPSRDAEGAVLAPREASVREQPFGRRYLQRGNHRGRGRGRDPRDRDRARDRRPAEPRSDLPAPDAPRAEASITDLLKPGQEILVQIAKEPLGKKGARITSHIALPGRYLVYMPTVDHVGVSRKILSDEERYRLKRVVQGHRAGMPGGFIVRTAGEGHSDDEIRSDMDFLYNLWLDLRQQAERRPAPVLVHHDLHLVERILRDQLTDTFKTIWVDSHDDYERILQFVERFQPALVGRVKLYTRSTPIFEEFGVSSELEKALRPKVWLKSGGYIVINQTEALVAIDVNTGKYVGKSNRLEDTIVKTNIDAVKEIVRQIRLRDLGGIIVVDFIDMDERKNRQKVMQALDEALREDRSPSKILQFNDFGLVAITRKRVKQSLERALCAPCPYCDGAGYLRSVETMILDVLTEAKKIAPKLDPGEVTLRVNSDVARVLKSRENRYLEELESILGRAVLVKSDPLLHQEKFDFN